MSMSTATSLSDLAAPAASDAATAPPRPLRRARGLPFIGVLPSLLRDAPGLFLRVARERPGESFTLGLGPATLHVLVRPAEVQHVLVDNWRAFGKGGMWEATRPLLGDGLVTAEGDAWLRQRRMMQPLFGHKHLATLADAMIAAVARECDRLAARAEAGRPVEMSAEMTQVTQRVLLETMFGTSLDPSQAERLGRALEIAFGAMNTRLFLYFLPKWLPLPGDRAFRQAIAAIDTALLEMVQTRRACNEPRHDLLSMLLAARDDQSGRGMTDRQLRDELVTLFSAGNDTTAVTLTWLFWLLDAHPAIDRRLRAEIDAVVGDRLPTFEDLGRLTYMKQVLQETMRLYPPAWIFPRTATGECVVEGAALPADAMILISPWVTHRDPTLWDRPDEFDPDRFAPERAAGRPRYAYLPFGGGPRQCIGNHFALMEAQLVTTMLLQRFRPRLVEGHPVTPAARSTLKPRRGMPMILDAA